MLHIFVTCNNTSLRSTNVWHRLHHGLDIRFYLTHNHVTILVATTDFLCTSINHVANSCDILENHHDFYKTTDSKHYGVSCDYSDRNSFSLSDKQQTTTQHHIYKQQRHYRWDTSRSYSSSICLVIKNKTTSSKYHQPLARRFYTKTFLHSDVTIITDSIAKDDVF